MAALKNEENFICKLLNETIEDNSKSSEESQLAEVYDLNEYFENRSKLKIVENKGIIINSFEELSKISISIKVFEGKYYNTIRCFRVFLNNVEYLDFPQNLFFFSKINEDTQNLYLEFDHIDDTFDLIKIFNSLQMKDTLCLLCPIEMLFVFFTTKNKFNLVSVSKKEETEKIIRDFIERQKYIKLLL